MAATAVELCNIALRYVGQRDRILSLSEESVAAEACQDFFLTSLNELLELADWPFARRRIVLSALAGQSRTGWDYVHSLPSDFIAARAIDPGTPTPAANQRIPHRIEMSDAGDSLVLLTNVEVSELIYTARVNVALMSPTFQKALAWRLASELAFVLPVKPQVGLAMARGFEQALQTALAASLNGDREDLEPDSEFIRERG